MAYTISLPNSKYGYLVPQEDVFLITKNIFVTADGITRDPTTPSDFSNKSMEEIFQKYPRPSGAKLAAEVFCQTFVDSLKDRRLSLKAVKEAFQRGNESVKNLNSKNLKEVDYLVNDYFGCVAAGGGIEDKKLYWGVIADCGIAVFNKEGKVKFQTLNDVKPFEGYVKRKKIDWKKPANRKLIRSEYRNKPNKTAGGKSISYGALTGEKEAEFFMKFGKIELTKGDMVVFYTDGFEEIIKQSDFFSKIYINSEFLNFCNKLASINYDKFGKEKSLVAVPIY